MKKLKLQKALIAICLALATTLTINKKIHAMKSDSTTNYWPNKHYLNDTVPKKPKTKYDTFLYNLDEYLNNITHPESLTEQQHKYFLRKYIRDDITKYLALLIQLAHYQTPLCQKNRDRLNNLLFKDPLEDRQGLHIIKDNAKNETISQFLNYIRDIISTDDGPRSKEKQILSLFFSPDPKETFHDLQTQMKELIHSYQDDENTKAYTFYSTLIRFLGPVANQLDREDRYQDGFTEDTVLAQLAQRIREFSKAYQTKLDKQKREQEEERKNNNKNEQKSDNGEEKAGESDIKEIEQLIQEWKQQKEETNKEKTAKLKN